ncbi:MAG TPA: glycerol-3-phosphate 1-O-acyltransferase PlsY [Terriglobales bacterium]|nr:glycerol-3-phosphate 1-O-acyltransferase PlsY [Terriglobales bacterium]
MIALVFIIVIVSYLLGSIPFGYLLVRVFRGQDVRKSGSGNIGATNVARTGSKGLGILTLLLDAAKGYEAVAFTFWLAARHDIERPTSAGIDGGATARVSGHTVLLLAALAAFMAILGHMFTVWLRFKGGKGVAAAAGSFVALAPRAMLVALILFVAVVALTRYVSLGSMVAGAAFPLCVWWLTPAERVTAPILLLIAASSLLIIVRHKDNIRRLLAGTENRFR